MQKLRKNDWMKRLLCLFLAFLIITDVTSHSTVPVLAEKQETETSEEVKTEPSQEETAELDKKQETEQPKKKTTEQGQKQEAEQPQEEISEQGDKQKTESTEESQESEELQQQTDMGNMELKTSDAVQTLRYEAEDAFVRRGKYRGGTDYSGEGYVFGLGTTSAAVRTQVEASDLTNADLRYVCWDVTVTEDTEAVIKIGAGTTTALTGAVVLNGSYQGIYNFSGSGSLSAIQNSDEIIVNLSAGKNSILITAPYNGNMNVDYADISIAKGSICRTYTRFEGENALGAGQQTTVSLEGNVDTNFFSNAGYRKMPNGVTSIPQNTYGSNPRDLTYFVLFAEEDMDDVDLVIGYGSNTAASPAGVYVQPVGGEEQGYSITIENTGFWMRAGRAQVTTSLKAGLNYIYLGGTQGTGENAYNLDYIEVQTDGKVLREATEAEKEAAFLTERYEAEDAFTYRGKVAYNEGFSNGAYVSAFNKAVQAGVQTGDLSGGGYVQWTVTSEKAMAVTVDLSYTLGSATSTIGVLVNGTYLTDLQLTGASVNDFQSTGSLQIPLKEGQNDIVFTAAYSGTQPRFDALDIQYDSGANLVKTFTRFEAENAYGAGEVKISSTVADDQWLSKWGYRRFTKAIDTVPERVDELKANEFVTWIIKSEEDLNNVDIVVGYGNGNTSNPGSFGVYVQPQGQDVQAYQANATAPGYWARGNRSKVTADLKAGINMVYVSGLTTGAYYLDYIDVAANGVEVIEVSLEDLKETQETAAFEAEDAFVYRGMYRGGSAGEGYSDSGFTSNFNNQTSANVKSGNLSGGGYVEWSLVSDKTAPAVVDLTYASKLAGAEIGLLVNGTFLQTVALEETQSGELKKTESILVTLKEGVNTIVFTAPWVNDVSLEMDVLEISGFEESMPVKAYTRLEGEDAVSGGSVTSGNLQETANANYFSGAKYRVSIGKPSVIPEESKGLTSNQYAKWTVYAQEDIEDIDIVLGYATTTPAKVGVYVQSPGEEEQFFTADIENTGYWARGGRSTVSGVSLKKGLNYILVSGCENSDANPWYNLDYIDVLTGGVSLDAAVTSRLEAEKAHVIRATVGAVTTISYSGGHYVGNMLSLEKEYTSVSDMENTGNVRFNFDSEEDMTADISFGYTSSTALPAVGVFLNGEYLGLHTLKPSSGVVGNYVISNLSLKEGRNTLVVTAPVKGTGVGADTAWVNYDYVDICGLSSVKFSWEKENTDGIYQAEEQTIIRANIKEDGAGYVYNIVNDSRENFESKLEFHVKAQADGFYYMTVRHRIDKYTNGWPAHEVKVTNGGWSTKSCFDTSGTKPVLNIADVNTDPQVYSPFLYYDDPTIGNWYESTIQIYLKAGENLIEFSKPTCYTDPLEGTSINFADVAIDYIKIEDENPDKNPPDFTDDMTSLDKLYSYTKEIEVNGDGCALQNLDTNHGDDNYIVYKMDEDITDFRLIWAVNEQDYYGEISVSADGKNWVKADTSKTPRLYMGSWIWRRTVVTNQGGLPAGMRYLRIQFPLVRRQNEFNTLNDSWYFQLHNVDIWTGETEGLYVTSPESYQIIQRDKNNKADVTVKGIAASADKVFVTLYKKEVNGDGTRGAAVNGFKHLSAKTDKQNTFALDLKQVPAGLYDIVIEAEGCEDIELTDVGIGDLWIIAGQSNSAGNAQLIEGEEVNDDPAAGVSVFYPDLQYWQQGKQPMGENKGQPLYSSFGLAFAKKVMAETKVPVGIFHTGVGGTSIQRWSLNAECEGGEDYGFLYKYQLLACFETGKNDFNIAGILWNQGTTDCSDNSMLVPVTIHGTTFKSKYEYLLYHMINQMHANFGDDITVIVNQIAKEGTRYSTVEQLAAKDKAWGIIRDAQRNIANRHMGVYVVPTSDGILWDNWLHNSAGSNYELSGRMSDIALKYHYKIGSYQEKELLYPSIRSASQTGKNTILLSFDNLDGVILTGSNFENEFSVLDAKGNKVGIQKAEIVGTGKNQILLTLTKKVPSGAVVNGLSACYLGDDIKLRTKANNAPILSFAYVKVEPCVKIEMSALPKTNYKIGENLNVKGGVLKVTHADGSTEKIKITKDMVYDFSSKKAGKTDLTVSYGGKITTYKIIIE